MVGEPVMVEWRGNIEPATVVGFRFGRRRLRALVRIDSSMIGARMSAPAEDLYGLQVVRLPRRRRRTHPS